MGPSAGRRRQLGKVLQFEMRGKSRATGKAGRAQTASILMFTGVRYEREVSSAPTKPTASPGTKRKRG